jgi:hypothetical protein
MSSVDTLITNAQNYASEASDTASNAITDLETLADRVSSLSYALSTGTWEFADVSEAAQEIQTRIRTLAMPVEPTGLGVFSEIDDLDDYTPKDYSDLKNTLKSAAAQLATLPDRFLQAAVLFDLVDSTTRSRLSSAAEVTNAEVNYAFDIYVQDEVEKISDASDDLLDKYAALGHTHAPGALLRVMQRAAKEAARTLSSQNRELTTKYADIAQDTTETYASLAIKSAAAQMGIGQEKFDAIVQAARVLVSSAQVEAKDKELEFKMYDLNFRKEATIQDIKIGLFRSTIAGWAAKFDALARSYAVIQQANADAMTATDMGRMKLLDEAKIKLDGFTTNQDLGIQVILEKISILSNKVAGALAGINSLVGQISSLTED